MQRIDKLGWPLVDDLIYLGNCYRLATKKYSFALHAVAKISLRLEKP
ncbi:hypothetical protein DSUL_160049 [Desulfovibrionales bacterium]